MSRKPYFELTDQWIAIVAPLAMAGHVLLKLKRYEFGRVKHGIPWPTQKRMAEEMRISRQAFSRAIGILQKLGFVSVEKKTASGGGVETFYTISVPVTDLVNLDEEVDLDLDTDMAHVAATLDPAPVVEKKGKQSKTDEKEQLWAQFMEKCHPGLNPHAAHKVWKKMALKDCVAALGRIEEYSQIYASASTERAPYITKISNWLAKEEFRADASVWRERAGASLTASGHKTSYTEAAKKKIQRV